MLSSMTGFGRSEGAEAGGFWQWELRSVNGRGLELRWRLPAGFDGMEPALREALAARLKRGSVQVTLTVRSVIAALPMVNDAALEHVLHLALGLAARVPGAPAPRVESLLALPGVMGARGAGDPAGDVSEAQAKTLRAGFAVAVERLVAARQAEGMRLGQVLLDLVRQMAALRVAAEAAAAAQPGQQRERLLASVAALMGSVPALPEERIAQEVALLASRSDVREELDRLGSHIEAVSAHLEDGETVGRQLDFLVQELVREANTICSKSATRELTAIGLKLKGLVEQVREQVQNLE
jgi:uncharacterized protein (TIGR00255 family)